MKRAMTAAMQRALVLASLVASAGSVLGCGRNVVTVAVLPDGTICGSDLPPCLDGQFCDLANACGGTTGTTGVCRNISQACAGPLQLQCGCSGVTYLDACQRYAAQDYLRNDGQCIPDPSSPCSAAQCADAGGTCTSFLNFFLDQVVPPPTGDAGLSSVFEFLLCSPATQMELEIAGGVLSIGNSATCMIVPAEDAGADSASSERFLNVCTGRCDPPSVAIRPVGTTPGFYSLCPDGTDADASAD